MKKNKILVPVLAVAGLGTTIAPLVVLTSCGKGSSKQEEGTKLTFEAFKECAATIINDFDKNHYSFNPNEVKIKTDIIGEVEEYNAHFVHDTLSDGHRLVKIDFGDGEDLEISFNHYYNKILNIINAHPDATYSFVEYKDYIHTEVSYKEKEGRIEVVTTEKFKLSKEGFLLQGEESAILPTQTVKKLVYLTYSTAPHFVTEFNVPYSEVGVYLVPHTSYTFNYTETDESSGCGEFWIGDSSSAIDFTTVSAKVDGEEVELSPSEVTPVFVKQQLPNNLTKGQTLKVKFAITGDAGVYKTIYLQPKQ